MAKGESAPPAKEYDSAPLDRTPILVMHKACPFTSPAEDLWAQAAEAAGKELKVVFADTPEGGSIIEAAEVRGVPCLIAATDRLSYGMLTPDEARSFLG